MRETAGKAEIKTVIFDVDNTLYDFDHANLRALKQVAAYAKEKLGWEEDWFFRECQNMINQLHDRLGDVSAAHNRLIRFQNMLEEEDLPLKPYALDMYRIYWDTVIDTANVSPGAAEVMQKLKEKGIRVGIGTDMTAWIQFQKLDRMHLLEYVDFIVSSEEASSEKLNQDFFDVCLTKTKCSAEECLFIGDSLTRDYHGALKAGMQARLFVPPCGLLRTEDPGDEQVQTISDLREVLKLV